MADWLGFPQVARICTAAWPNFLYPWEAVPQCGLPLPKFKESEK